MKKNKDKNKLRIINANKKNLEKAYKILRTPLKIEDVQYKKLLGFLKSEDLYYDILVMARFTQMNHRLYKSSLPVPKPLRAEFTFEFHESFAHFVSDIKNISPKEAFDEIADNLAQATQAYNKKNYY